MNPTRDVVKRNPTEKSLKKTQQLLGRIRRLEKKKKETKIRANYARNENH